MHTGETTQDGHPIYKQQAGEDDREWTVIPQDAEHREYIVQYPDKNKAQVVTLDAEEGHECTGTRFEYHGECPHVDACLTVREGQRTGHIRQYESEVIGYE